MTEQSNQLKKPSLGSMTHEILPSKINGVDEINHSSQYCYINIFHGGGKGVFVGGKHKDRPGIGLLTHLKTKRFFYLPLFACLVIVTIKIYGKPVLTFVKIDAKFSVKMSRASVILCVENVN